MRSDPRAARVHSDTPSECEAWCVDEEGTPDPAD
jgi:hypothetical protein